MYAAGPSCSQQACIHIDIIIPACTSLLNTCHKHILSRQCHPDSIHAYELHFSLHLNSMIYIILGHVQVSVMLHVMMSVVAYSCCCTWTANFIWSMQRKAHLHAHCRAWCPEPKAHVLYLFIHKYSCCFLCLGIFTSTSFICAEHEGVLACCCSCYCFTQAHYRFVQACCCFVPACLLWSHAHTSSNKQNIPGSYRELHSCRLISRVSSSHVLIDNSPLLSLSYCLGYWSSRILGFKGFL